MKNSQTLLGFLPETLICCILFFSFLPCYSQEAYVIKGRAIFSDNRPVDERTITVISKSGDTIGLSKTDLNGYYTIKMDVPGNYYMVFSGLDMESTEIAFTIMDKKHINIPETIIPYRTNQLDEVKINIEKPKMEFSGNKLIYNIRDNESEGFSALELLRKVPGLAVDGNNNILLKGQANVKIMINNKMMELSKSDLNSILEAKSSSEIDNIEVIENPSSRYDASGSAGIVNINLKKAKNETFHSTISSTFIYGVSPKYNNSLVTSFRRKALSLYANLNATNGKYRRWLSSQKRLENFSGTSVYLKDRTKGETDQNLYSFNFGGDYSFNNFHNLAFEVNGILQRNQDNTSTNTKISSNGDLVDSLLNSDYDANNKKNDISYGLSYTFRPNDDHSLFFSLDYSDFITDNNAFQPNRYYSTAGDPLSSRISKLLIGSDIDIFAVKIDGEFPFLKGKLTTGAKFSHVGNDNDFSFYNLENENFKIDLNQSNNFKYNENIAALYVEFARNWKRFNFQVGLRGEQTNSKGTLSPVNSTETLNETKREYTNLFPSGSVNFMINDVKKLGFSFSRRIDRPNYQTLNPFEYRMSELIVQKGNPYLRPQYSNKLSLQYLSGENFSMSVGYNDTKQFLNQIIDTIGNNAVAFIPFNLGSTQTIYYDLSYSTSILPKWKTSTYMYLSKFHISADLDKGLLDHSIFGYYFSNNNDLKLGESWSVNVMGYINGPFYYGTFRNKPTWSVDFGLTKQIFQGKGSIILNAVNIFNTNIIRSRMQFGGIDQTIRDRNENRLFKLTFSYRINSNKEVSKKFKSGSTEEQQRTN